MALQFRGKSATFSHVEPKSNQKTWSALEHVVWFRAPDDIFIVLYSIAEHLDHHRFEEAHSPSTEGIVFKTKSYPIIVVTTPSILRFKRQAGLTAWTRTESLEYH